MRLFKRLGLSVNLDDFYDVFLSFLICERFGCVAFQWMERILKIYWKFKIFTYPHIVSNLYDFVSSAEHKSRYFEEYW